MIGINNTVSSSSQLYIEEQQISGIRFIKQGKGKIYPLSEFPENARILPGFLWRGDERLYEVNDIFKDKPLPVLPKIKGIPLPKDEGNFFEDMPEEGMQIPEASKLKPKNLQNNPEDPKPDTIDQEKDKVEEQK